MINTKPKLMNSKFSSFLLIAFVLVFISGCLKKGEDDPLISFRTRKARVVGKWKIKKGKKISASNTTTISTTYSQDKYEQTYSLLSYTPSITSGDIKYTIEFKKDGKVAENRILEYSDRFSVKGTWNFTGRVGKEKNKEQIVLHDERTSLQSDIVYTIKELRNKKLVLYRSFDYMGNSFQEEYEFEQ